jgi:hypothetical protein
MTLNLLAASRIHFGGEGLRHTSRSGNSYMSLPFSRLADRIIASGAGGNSRDEGSLLG